MSDPIIEKIIQKLSPIAEFIYLLGSYGTPRFHQESDIDIAFYPKSPSELLPLFQLKMDLESELNRDIDLVSLHEIDPIFARQVLETGRILWTKDPELYLAWKVKQLSLYPDFKRSREIIEKNLLRRRKYV